MDEKRFSDWERVIVAFDINQIAGYCTVLKEDCVPNVGYSPFIGFVFVKEKYRGHRLSEQLISFACDYLVSIGFEKVFLTSNENGLYEKYGFEIIDEATDYWGNLQKIYQKSLILYQPNEKAANKKE